MNELYPIEYIIEYFGGVQKKISLYELLNLRTGLDFHPFLVIPICPTCNVMMNSLNASSDWVCQCGFIYNDWKSVTKTAKK